MDALLIPSVIITIIVIMFIVFLIDAILTASKKGVCLITTVIFALIFVLSTMWIAILELPNAEINRSDNYTSTAGGTDMGFWNIFIFKNISICFGSAGKSRLEELSQTNFSPNFKIHNFHIGQNRDPLSKIRDFEQYIRNKIKSGGKVDIAMMKFCYNDLPTVSLTPEELFNEYKRMVRRLTWDYPKLSLIHMTIPLTSIRTDTKIYIKVLVNRLFGGYSKNAVRQEYNEMLRKEFGKDVFDIAKVVSNHYAYTEHGVPALCPHYTDDGQHLNRIGKSHVATKFNNFLVEYVKTNKL